MGRKIFILIFLSLSIACGKTHPSYEQPNIGIKSLERFERLPEFKEGVRAGQFSSHDRNGLNIDLSNFLYKEDSSFVIFDVEGAGCIYRMWFTFVAEPAGGLKFYLDGEEKPKIDMEIKELFSGNTYPFLSPLVGDREGSSGGYYSYIPICFQNGGKVIITTSFLQYYNITYHSFTSSEGVKSYSEDDDPSGVLEQWENPGIDPKTTDGNILSSGIIDIPPSSSAEIFQTEGAGYIASIKLRIDPATEKSLLETWIKMFWDEKTPAQVEAPLGEFFGSGLGLCEVESLPVGMNQNGEFYCFFPMPYWKEVRIELENLSTEEVKGLSYEIQYNPKPYPQKSGYFRTQYRSATISNDGKDYLILNTTGRGHYMGVVLTMVGLTRYYLEGDERIYVDGSLSPQIYGTGTEDYFNGGWYFQKGTFSLPSHGNPAHKIDSLDRTTAYRFHIGDWIPFNSSIRVGIEHGGLNDMEAEYSSVAFYYGRDEVGLVKTDELNIGDPESEGDHSYSLEDEIALLSNTYFYEGDEDDIPITDEGRYFSTPSRFTTSIHPKNRGVKLRRRSDQEEGRQKAQVSVNGKKAGIWYTSEENPYKRWLDDEFEIDPIFTRGKSSITVEVKPLEGHWNEYRYWIYSYLDP